MFTSTGMQRRIKLNVNLSTAVSAQDRRIIIDNGRKLCSVHKHLSERFPSHLHRRVSVYNWLARYRHKCIREPGGPRIFNHRSEWKIFRTENGEIHAHPTAVAGFFIFEKVFRTERPTIHYLLMY